MHDFTISTYAYNITCTGIGSQRGTAKTSITVRIGLVTLADQAEDYYRPTAKAALQDIIAEERTNKPGRQNINSLNLNMIGTSAITNMSDLFFDAKTFTGDVTFNRDMSNWNMSNVISMVSMFEKAFQFNRDISNWNTISIQSMSAMFLDAKIFNQDISGWDVSSVNQIPTVLFYGATAFNKDLSRWKFCKFKFQGAGNSMFTGSAMDGDTAQYPKFKGDAACKS